MSNSNREILLLVDALAREKNVGKEIVFSPRQPLIQIGRNPLVTQLIERVDAARRA